MNRCIQRGIWVGVFTLFSICSCISFAFGEFEKVLPGKLFQFPRDHGAHNDFPVEWWYFTGHLTAEGSLGEASTKTFGFELTFFRVAVNSTQLKAPSPWHVQSLFLAHAALTDDQGEKFYFEKRIRRPNFSAAGASSERLDVHLDDWSVKQAGRDENEYHLSFAATSEKDGAPFRVELLLKSFKPPVLQGVQGYSQKGSDPSDASYYVSLTRLLGDGALEVGGARHTVTAQAWMDHEVLSSKPQDEDVGWDWFAIQLENNTECMLYHLRRGKAGKTSPYSSGSCVDREGKMTKLSLSDYSITPVGKWQSPRTRITYPSGWRIQIPSQGLQLEVLPTVKDQELSSRGAATRTYWEGRSLVSGFASGEPVQGAAYVELVGYR